MAFSLPNGRFLATSKELPDYGTAPLSSSAPLPPAQSGGFQAAPHQHQVILWNASDKYRFVKSDQQVYSEFARESIALSENKGSRSEAAGKVVGSRSSGASGATPSLGKVGFHRCLMHKTRIATTCFSQRFASIGVEYPVLMSASVDGDIRLWEYINNRDPKSVEDLDGEADELERVGRQFLCTFIDGKKKILSAAMSTDG